MKSGINKLRWCILTPFLSVHLVFGATEISEDFNAMSLPTTLEQSSCCATVSFTNAAAVFPGVGNDGRVYLRSVDDDFHSASYVFEVTVTLTTGFGGAGAAFVGLGRGEPADSFYKEPRDGPHLYLRIFAGDSPWLGSVTVVDDADEVFDSAADVAGAGTHRIRMIWNAANGEASFQIHRNYTSGSFVASTTIGPYSGSDNSFSDNDSRIFFGGSSGITFDDLSVTLPRDELIFIEGFEASVSTGP